MGAVNFPNITIPYGGMVSFHLDAKLTKLGTSTHRILNIHRNVPGVLKGINELLSDFNITTQILSTNQDVGSESLCLMSYLSCLLSYLVVEVDKEASAVVKEQISALQHSVKTRILY